MAKFYDQLDGKLRAFIEEQKMFFVATCGVDSTINLSPKGLDTLRILDDQSLIWLNLTGSGNETSAHLKEVNRMTIMFCSYRDKPMILRLYCEVTEFMDIDDEWDELIKHFSGFPGARNIFRCEIRKAQTSCGFAVPHYEFTEHRDTLEIWAKGKGEEGIRHYWQEKNELSIDGKPTRLGSN